MKNPGLNRWGNGVNGGITKPQDAPWPGNMALYTYVDILDRYAPKIIHTGGKILVNKIEIPGVGLLLMFKDPTKRVLGKRNRDWFSRKYP